MKRTICILVVVAIQAAAIAAPVVADDQEPEPGTPIPNHIFLGSPGSRIVAAIDYAGLELTPQAEAAIQALSVTMNHHYGAVASGEGPPKVPKVPKLGIEACSEEGTCGGTYHSDSHNTYVVYNNRTNNVCTDTGFQFNLITGDNNSVCTVYDQSSIHYVVFGGASCTVDSDGARGSGCGAPGAVESFAIFLTCNQEFLHNWPPCPGLNPESKE